MELDSLKSAWKGMDDQKKNREELKKMLSENKHPVLKGIRIQLIIEMTAWTFFLFFYYNIFDGDRRPFLSNLLLVAAVLLLLVHSLTGYFSARKVVMGNNLKQSLVKYLANLKIYAYISVTSRVLTIVCVLIFFTSTIIFTPQKYTLLAAMSLLIPLQIFILTRIWRKRIRQLTWAITGLTE